MVMLPEASAAVTVTTSVPGVPLITGCEYKATSFPAPPPAASAK